MPFSLPQAHRNINGVLAATRKKVILLKDVSTVDF